MGRGSTSTPLPDANHPRVDNSHPSVQRAFDMLATAVMAISKFLGPFAQQEAWKDITFQNSFTNFYNGTGEAFNTAQYRKDPLGRVELRGLVKRTVAGFAGVAITQLPVGYRPKHRQMFNVIGNNKTARLDISSTGVVDVEAADSATPEQFISLDGITFDTR